jgi:hypothetical protein
MGIGSTRRQASAPPPPRAPLTALAPGDPMTWWLAPPSGPLPRAPMTRCLAPPGDPPTPLDPATWWLAPPPRRAFAHPGGPLLLQIRQGGGTCLNKPAYYYFQFL